MDKFVDCGYQVYTFHHHPIGRFDWVASAETGRAARWAVTLLFIKKSCQKMGKDMQNHKLLAIAIGLGCAAPAWAQQALSCDKSFGFRTDVNNVTGNTL